MFNELLFDIAHLKGETKIREVKTRVNQNVFRQIVLANYNKQCAITGIDIPDLLFAGHIIPWAANEQERLNPENGICLSALYDKKFDKGFIGINANYEVILSVALKKNKSKDYFVRYWFVNNSITHDFESEGTDTLINSFPTQRLCDSRHNVFVIPDTMPL